MLLTAIEAMEADAPSRRPPAAPSPRGGRRRAAPTEDPPARPIDELLAELDALVGLAGVKHEVKLVTNLLRVQRIRAERGLPVLEQSRHLIFTGNPGTGKTTVARLLAQIYRTLGVVARGHLVETDRSGLVAGYVGQTAPLVLARFDEADQGVLLIDEAYSLVRGGERDFGREAIDAIVKLIEDRRDRIVVVMAGYPDEMEELIASNPGLRSRFPKVIHFPDYTTDELLQIMDTLGEKGGYRLDPGARARARTWLDSITPGQGLRQRPHRPQPLRARRLDAGHAARPDRHAQRRRADHARRRGPPCSGRGAAHGRPTTRRYCLTCAAGAGGPRCSRHDRGGHRHPPGDRRRRRLGRQPRPHVGGHLRRGPDRPVRRPSGPTVEVRSEPAATTAAAITDGTVADDVDAWITTTAWLEVVDGRAPDALGDRRALATSPTVVATAPGRYDAISDLCVG